MIKLIRPSAADREKAIDFRNEFFDNGETVINGSELLDRTESYDDWLAAVKDNSRRETVNPDWVVTDTYFAVDHNDGIVGIIDLRHELKGFLEDFGHAGYSVRPSERGKGYASEMLRLLTIRAKEAGLKELLLSAERNNEPSVRTIVKNGGVYKRSFDFEGETADVYSVSL